MNTADSNARRRDILSRKRRRRDAKRWTASLKLLVIAAVFLLVYYSLRPLYYQLILGPEIDIVVYCDTDALTSEDAHASVLYDKLAMSPIPRLLGLYQNRPAEKVKSFHAIRVDELEFTEASVILRDIPDGPIRQVNIYSNGQWYYAPLDDINRKDDKLFIFLD